MTAGVVPEAPAAVVRSLGWMAQVVVDDDGTRWGDSASEFQMANAAAILDRTAGVRQFFWPGTRGARKSSDIAALALTLLETQAGAFAKGFFIASDEDQAKDLVDIAGEMVARTPGLRELFDVTASRITHLRTGATFTALANDPSAMGKRPWVIFADELSVWPDTRGARKFWTAMTTASEKVPGCRLVVATNAGSPSHWSFKRFETAKRSRHWQVLHVPAPLPWHTGEALERARENCTTEAEFRRLFHNEWTDEDSRLTSLEQVRACVSDRARPLRPRHAVRYVAGLDVGWVNDRTVLVVAHLEPRMERFADDLPWSEVRREGPEGAPRLDQRASDALFTVVVDYLRVWQGSKAGPVDLSEVEGEAVRVAARYGATLIFDPREMVGAEQRARRIGLVTQAFHFTPGSKAELATTMIRQFRAQAFDLPDDEELIDELAHVNVKETSLGMVALDHDAGRHDDRAIALALSAHHLLAGTKAEAARAAGLRTVTQSPRWAHVRDRGGARASSGGASMEQLVARLAERGDPSGMRLSRANSGGQVWR